MVARAHRARPEAWFHTARAALELAKSRDPIARRGAP